MKRYFRISLILALALIPASYNACGVVQFGSPKAYSTVAGNPMTSTQASQEILFAICSVLDRCQQVPFNTCTAGVLATSGVASALGLPSGTYDPYSSLESAESSGTLTANLSNTNTCVDTINILGCKVPAVEKAYNPASSNPFSAVPNMIPTQACAGVFTNNYEYIYFGDSNKANLPGYAINASSGVLTAVGNSPAALGNSLSLSKIAANSQILAADGGSGGSAYWINPATGVLNPVTGTGFLSGSGVQETAFSPDGLFVFAVANTQKNAWIAQVSPTTGNFSNPVETANFSAPMTKTWNTIVSPSGKYVYFVDPYNKAIEGFSTVGGALTEVSGGLTLLPAPNAGSYNSYQPPYLDSAASVIYLFFNGATGTDNNWVIPYKINGDGSLSAGTPLNVGTNPGTAATGIMVGDSTGKYLFVGIPGGTGGVSSYSIGVNGSLTYVSGPALTKNNLSSIKINSENTLIYASGGTLTTASINMGNGSLTPVSSVVNPCGGAGQAPATLDATESFIFVPVATSVCGFTVSSSGVLGKISGQTYPLSIPGSASIVSSLAVQMTYP